VIGNGSEGFLGNISNNYNAAAYAYQVEEDEYSSYVVLPEPEDKDPSLYTSVYFYVRDNVTNKDLTPLQKDFAEKYDFTFSCNVNSVKVSLNKEII